MPEVHLNGDCLIQRHESLQDFTCALCNHLKRSHIVVKCGNRSICNYCYHKRTVQGTVQGVLT